MGKKVLVLHYIGTWMGSSEFLLSFETGKENNLNSTYMF
jgi:hypothetical protein